MIPAPDAASRGSAEEWAQEVAALVDSGADRRESITRVAEAHGVPRREVYEAVVRAKHADGPGVPERK